MRLPGLIIFLPARRPGPVSVKVPRTLPEDRIDGEDVVLPGEVENERVFSDLNRPSAVLLRFCDPLHMLAGVCSRAEGVEVIEDRRRVIDSKADFGDLAVSRGDVLVAEEDEARKTLEKW